MLRLENGKFGFTDMYGARMQGTQKLVCELTVRNGKVVYDLNGISRPDWDKLPKDYLQTGDPRWDGLNPDRRAAARPAAAASREVFNRFTGRIAGQIPGVY